MNKVSLEEKINQVWDTRTLLTEKKYQQAVLDVIKCLDEGFLRVVEANEGEWVVNEWIKKAILLYFQIKEMNVMEVGMMEYYDKIPLKKNFKVERVTSLEDVETNLKKLPNKQETKESAN